MAPDTYVLPLSLISNQTYNIMLRMNNMLINNASAQYEVGNLYGLFSINELFYILELIFFIGVVAKHEWFGVMDDILMRQSKSSAFTEAQEETNVANLQRYDSPQLEGLTRAMSS